MKPVVFLIFLIGVGAMIQRTVDFSLKSLHSVR